MELSQIIQTVSDSLKTSNEKISERNKDELGFTPVEFSISFPAEFKIIDHKTEINFVDMKTQIYSSSVESSVKKRLFGLFRSKEKKVSESSNVAMISIILKPMPF